MPEDNDKEALEQLDKRINKLKTTISEQDKTAENDGSSVYRLSIEFASGVFVGIFIGYWVDKWLDTSPIFFLIFLFLGVAAGFFNIYKLATKE